MSELKPCPCPICGAELKIYGPEDWHPTFDDPDSGGDPYNAVCDCGFQFSNGSYDYAEFVVALNLRPQPANEPKRCVHYCDDGGCMADSCHFQTDNGDCEIAGLVQSKKPANEPLTLEELRGMDGEPVYLVDIEPVEYGWEDGWYLVDADEDVAFNGTRKYGLKRCAGFAYFRPPERSENDAKV